MKRLLTVSLLTALACPLLFAATVTGKWSGTMEMRRADGQSRTVPAVLILKQDGEIVTGSAGANETSQQPIRNGKLDGDRLTFDIESANQQSTHFDLKVSEDAIEGSAEGPTPDGGKATARIMVKRVAAK